MSGTKKANTAPRVTTLADDALVTILDKNSGALTTIEFGNLKNLIKDSIKVGGRNYIKNSKDIAVTSAVYGVCKIGELSEPLNVGETYIISCEEKSEELSDSAYLTLTTTTGSSPATVTIGIPFVASSPSKYIWLWAKNPALLGSVNFNVKKAKLERGNIATDWSPAPEDLINVGGVKATLSECYVLAKKGGQRHEQSDQTPHRRNTQNPTPGRNDLSRRCRGFRQRNYDWHLQRDEYRCWNSIASLSLWNFKSNEVILVPCSGISSTPKISNALRRILEENQIQQSLVRLGVLRANNITSIAGKEVVAA